VDVHFEYGALSDELDKRIADLESMVVRPALDLKMVKNVSKFLIFAWRRSGKWYVC